MIPANTWSHGTRGDMSSTNPQATVFQNMVVARYKADEKWGRATGSNGPWIRNPQLGAAILMEEVGEVARAILERDSEAVERELYDVGQVVVAWLESFEAKKRADEKRQYRIDNK